MFNKTDTTQSGNNQNPASVLASSKVNENQREIINQAEVKAVDAHQRNNIISYLQKFKLSIKEVIFSLAIGTLPVLGIAVVTYNFGSKLINQQIISNQEAKVISLSDNLNQLMLSRKADIEIISNLPFLTNAKISQVTTFAEKQAGLNRFIATYKIYDNIAVFDLNGKVIFQSKDGNARPQKNLKYFQDVIQNNAPIISQPETLQNGKVVIYIAAPVQDIVTRKTIAIVRTRIPIELLVEEIKNYVANSDDYYLLDDSGKFIFSLKPDLLGQQATVIYPGLATLITRHNGDGSTAVQTINQPLQLVSYVPLKKIPSLPDLNLHLIVAKDSAIALEPQRKFLLVIANITTLTALLMTLIAAGLVKGIGKQNNSESARLETLAEDEIKMPLSQPKNDESLPVVKEWELQVNGESNYEQEWQQQNTLHLQLLKLINQIENAAKGNLTIQADVIDGEVGNIAHVFNSIVEKLRYIVTQIKQTTRQVNHSLDSNQDTINYLGEQAITQVENINYTLTAVEQMSNAIQVLATDSQEVANIYNHAHETATKSEKVMDLTLQNLHSWQETVGETAKKVRYLGESSQQISRVVYLMNQIAMQTNLLAINAGIEAARAGEEGQGFAVVAEEVGELAARSAAATQEIEQIVEKIKRDTNEVVQAMELGNTQVVESKQIFTDAKQSLTDILDVSQQIDTLLNSISVTSVSQIEISQVIRKLMQDIAAIAQLNRDSYHQISESLQATSQISQQLNKNVESFKIN
ncbi:methyl-accepting chemotaxis protein [Sphaerospermopsis aphanizomenoides BCCUSP55]|uniref:methyl-accepting chemotaxis protein n=1 Tax=Sphaerospermopsis aphanizomenoides TaxID=459663 RepID=UPI001907799C|nr:methyl-accepting chemotaxis protein [Sphaerospermopsis aphanizomenoides]MBK1987869.1 methyl-accepting chemotaxis protein [Sphaerospermopsis aphanizomenoides BCCUSP55]